MPVEEMKAHNKVDQTALEEKKQKLEDMAEKEKARKLSEVFDLPTGQNGYLDDVSLRKDEKATIDWDQVLDKGLERLRKMNAKNPDDLIFALFEIMLLSPVDMMTNALNQARKNMKENRKKAEATRQSFIENNLKSNNLTRVSLAAKLSRQVQNWLLNDPAYQNLPAQGPYTKYQKAIMEKKNFAARLPKLSDGNIDFSRMTFAQKRRYTTYLTCFARSNMWRQYLNEMSGVQLRESEVQSVKNSAVRMKAVRLPKEVLMNTR